MNEKIIRNIQFKFYFTDNKKKKELICKIEEHCIQKITFKLV